jgi:hypothetical protein
LGSIVIPEEKHLPDLTSASGSRGHIPIRPGSQAGQHLLSSHGAASGAMGGRFDVGDESRRRWHVMIERMGRIRRLVAMGGNPALTRASRRLCGSGPGCGTARSWSESAPPVLSRPGG